MIGSPRVAIGVHVHAEPAGLRETLANIEKNTTGAVELLVIPDGVDDDTRAYLDDLRSLRILNDVGATGGAACLNRLRDASPADIVVLLESGCRVGPDWLTPILRALERPSAGLAGPSTNRSWNAQNVFPGAAGGDEAIERAAADAQRRFGDEYRTLAPLYSLADFCYAVRREVFDAIGGADDGYGLGPCWEMDFNVRAARAGFDGLFAGASYVWRAPVTPRRAREEAVRFDASRRRYQDKFCGARRRGVKHDYRPHCFGDACPNFAPAGPPLVSCIMPTYNRRPYISLALDRFHEQTYAHRELIVVDDGDDPVVDLVGDLKAVRYLRSETRLSIGAKRNLACAAAQGEIIVHWDDDDWYAPDRLARQTAPILNGDADITGLENAYVLQMPEQRFWTVAPQLHRAMFVGDVHGGTLAFRRALWAGGIHYPAVDLAEDARWLLEATGRGHRLLKLENGGSFVYLRHSTNAWRFETGSFLDPAGWRESCAPAGFSRRDLAAYAAAAASSLTHVWAFHRNRDHRPTTGAPRTIHSRSSTILPAGGH
jgi:glycosyltransferase involved in cell wall biosynthesis